MIIECKNNTSNIEINNQGTITFLTKCRVSTKDFIVEVAGNPTEVKLEQSKITPEPEEVIQFEDLKNSKLPTEYTSLKLIDSRKHNQDFMAEAVKINNLQEITKRINAQRQNINKNIVNGISIFSGSTIILIIAAVIVYIWLKKYKTTKRTITKNIFNIEGQHNKHDEVTSNMNDKSPHTGLRIL